VAKKAKYFCIKLVKSPPAVTLKAVKPYLTATGDLSR
jgi:hypothetical protein